MADPNGGGGGRRSDDDAAFLSRGLPTLEAPSNHNSSHGKNYRNSNNNNNANNTENYDESYPPITTINIPSHHPVIGVPPTHSHSHAQYGIVPGATSFPMMVPGGSGWLTPPPPAPPMMAGMAGTSPRMGAPGQGHGPPAGMVPGQLTLHPDAYDHGGGGVRSGGHYHQQHHQQPHHSQPHQPQQQFGNSGNERQRGQQQKQGQQRRRRGMTRDPRVWGRYWKVKLQKTNPRLGDPTRSTTTPTGASTASAADDYKPSKSEMWLAAISEAENKAQEGGGGGRNSINGNSNNHSGGGGNRGRGRGRRKPYRSSNGGNTDNDNNNGTDNGTADDSKPPKLEAAGYLKHLRNLVEGNTALHDHLPNFNPPPPRWDFELVEEIERAVLASSPGGTLAVGRDWGTTDEPGGRGGRAVGPGGGGNSDNASRLNRYSAFDSDDDDDDDDSSNSGDDGDDDDDDGELSDEEIVYHPTNSASTVAAVASPASPKPQGRKRIKMVMRRIVVRILASQADIHASIAIDYSRARPVARWLDGADSYETSFNVLTTGQLIVDTQYAKLLQEEEELGISVGTSRRDTKRIAALERKKADLADDSEIIAVSLSSFVRNRDRYINAANSRIEYLESRLYENQQRREEIRQAMGDRWTSNPNARGDHAERRKKMEEELRQAQQGVERMGRINLKQMVRTGDGGRRLVDV